MLSPERILVIRRKAIGDILVSLPVVEALHRRWPRARVDLVVDRFAEDLLRDYAGVDRLLVYDPRTVAAGGLSARAAALRDWWSRLREGRYDLVLDLLGTPQTAAWTRATGAPARVGRARRGRTWAYTHRLPPRGDARFAGEVFLDWVRVLGVVPEPWRPVAPVPPGPRTPRERPRVLLNPSASWPAKAWPLQHFRELAAGLVHAEGAEVGVAWGPGEEAARDAIADGSLAKVKGLPPTRLRELARHLEDADLVVGTDSGPKHLAVAMGTPTLTLFGSTDPRGWQPPGVEHVGLTNPVDCHPCDLLECPVPGHPCLDQLTPERVLRAAALLLTRSARRTRR